jgi:hypothetical protein
MSVSSSPHLQPVGKRAVDNVSDEAMLDDDRACPLMPVSGDVLDNPALVPSALGLEKVYRAVAVNEKIGAFPMTRLPLVSARERPPMRWRRA